MKGINHNIVFRHNGAWYYTPKDAFVPLEDFNEEEYGSLNKKVFKGDSDDYGCSIEVLLYEVREITLPDWLSAAEYCYNSTMWEKMPQVLGDLAFTWPERWVRCIMKMERAERDVCLTLLHTHQFRSSFRQSCRNHLVEWLNDPNAQYDTPFSQKQLQALLPQRWYR